MSSNTSALGLNVLSFSSLFLSHSVCIFSSIFSSIESSKGSFSTTSFRSSSLPKSKSSFSKVTPYICTRPSLPTGTSISLGGSSSEANIQRGFQFLSFKVRNPRRLEFFSGLSYPWILTICLVIRSLCSLLLQIMQVTLFGISLLPSPTPAPL